MLCVTGACVYTAAIRMSCKYLPRVFAGHMAYVICARCGNSPHRGGLNCFPHPMLSVVLFPRLVCVLFFQLGSSLRRQHMHALPLPLAKNAAPASGIQFVATAWECVSSKYCARAEWLARGVSCELAHRIGCDSGGTLATALFTVIRGPTHERRVASQCIVRLL